MSWNILRGISGDFEIGRGSLAIGGFFTVISPIAFEIYEIGWNGGHFEVAAWCAAYPGGLALFVTGVVLAIGKKEKAIADAKVVTAQSQATP